VPAGSSDHAFKLPFLLNKQAKTIEIQLPDCAYMPERSRAADRIAVSRYGGFV
jgi:hypothetical protein